MVDNLRLNLVDQVNTRKSTMSTSSMRSARLIYKTDETGELIEIDVINKVKDFYPSKLFNYMIQSLETERNILVLKSLLKKTKDFKSTLVLYHYDSFLFDYNKNDGDKFVEIVQKELQQDGFPVKMKRGKNYDELI